MPSLSLRNLSIGYSQKPIVCNINANLSSGDLVYLCGRNGEGKSSLIKTLCGIIPPIEGGIFWNNDPIPLPKPGIQPICSLVLSKHQIPPHLSVYEVAAHGLQYKYQIGEKPSLDDEEKIVEILKKLQLDGYFSFPAYKLSDGFLQKLLIARALIANSPVILLDEPTAHLDPKNKNSILSLLKEISVNEKKAVCIISHDAHSCIPFANEVWYITQKKLETFPYNTILKHLIFKNEYLGE